MSKRTKRFLIVAMVFGVAAIMSGRIFAEDGTGSSGSGSGTSDKTGARIEAQKTETEGAKTTDAAKTAESEKHNANAEKNCTEIQSKVEKANAKYKNDKNRNVIAYMNMHDRIAKFSARFTAKGLDTTKLTTDLSTLDTKVALLKTDHDDYLAKLALVKQSACSKPADEFKATLLDARTAMAHVKVDIADIHSFYETVLRADLVALKAQVAAEEGTTSTGDSTKSGSTSTSDSSTTPSTTSKEIK